MILKRVGTSQRVDTSEDTIMDVVSKKERIIANMDADKDVTLKDVTDIAKEVVVDTKIEESVDVHGRQVESQAQIYQIDLEHNDKVLSMQGDELEPAELQKVVEVVTTAKLMTEVVTAASATITAADTLITAAAITAAPSAARRRKGVDEAYARELEAKLNKNINWDDVIDQVQRKEKEDNVLMRNIAGFKMDYFKGMKYDDIRLIFEKYFNSNVAFLENIKEQMEEEDSRALKRTSESQAEKVAKKQKLDKEVPVVDYEIYTENNKPYYKIKDLHSSKPKNFLDDFLLTTLTYMFEKPDVQAQVWKNQRTVHGLAKVKSWRLLESCGVHIITFTSKQMILLVERRYPLVTDMSKVDKNEAKRTTRHGNKKSTRNESRRRIHLKSNLLNP
nr:hypothetical protein [Tanacetum cinerariifolium]